MYLLDMKIDSGPVLDPVTLFTRSLSDLPTCEETGPYPIPVATDGDFCHTEIAEQN
jgi:hypothetical protein